MPFGSTNGSDRILLNEKAESLTYRLKSKGLKMQPWRTPLAYSKDRVWLFPILTQEVEFEYKLLITRPCSDASCNFLYRFPLLKNCFYSLSHHLDAALRLLRTFAGVLGEKIRMHTILKCERTGGLNAPRTQRQIIFIIFKFWNTVEPRVGHPLILKKSCSLWPDGRVHMITPISTLDSATGTYG